MRNLKFATKILLIILGVSIVSMITVSTISYTELLNLSEYSQDVNVQLGFYASDNSKEALIRQAESYMTRLSASQASECNEDLAKIQGEVTAMVGFMEDLYKNPGNFQGRALPLPNEVAGNVPTAKMLVAKNVEMSPEVEREMRLVSNAEYMFGNIFAVDSNLSNAYMGTESGINFRYSLSNAYDPDYDPRTRPWYRNAYAADGPIWLDTYVDPYGFICTTCSQVFLDADGSRAGVVATDIYLSTMVDDILNLRIGETGYAFLLDENGQYLAHPRYNELNPDALGTAQGEYKTVLASMAAGESDVRQAAIDGMDYYIAYAPLAVTGWSLGIAVEYDEIIAGAVQMKTDIDSQALTAKEQIRAMLNSVMFRFIVLTGVIIIAVLILSVLVSGSISRPVLQLTNGVMEVGKGNLDHKIDIKAQDEIGVLADCFNKMTDDLKDYIANLSEVTAEKERINSDLRIATEIQADMLPKIFPPYANRDDLQIAAFMQPAKEVGGDFYDFFFLDDEQTKIALVIADVSGKGVPAALFMVIAKILIKNNKDLAFDEILGAVNNLLCADNNAGMFVTAFYSVLDISTGRFTYVNAGHNPPVLYRNQTRDVSLLSMPKSPPLGVFLNRTFASRELTLEKGDALVLYTDGVTEAFNTRSEEYGVKRLLENAAEFVKQPVETGVKGLYETVKTFAGEEPQSDDITMLLCRYLGRG